MNTGIYFLHNGDYQPRYVGMTTVSFEGRLLNHKAKAKQVLGKKGTYVKNWINSIEGDVYMHILEFANDNIGDKETYWIKNLKEKGYDLCNHSEGGKAEITFKLNDKQVSELISDYKTGIKIDDIASSFDLSRSGVIRYLKRNDIKLRGSKSSRFKSPVALSLDDEKKVIDIWNELNPKRGLQAKLSRDFNTTKDVIKGIVKRINK